MQSVVIERIEESVHEHPATKPIAVGAALQQIEQRPLQALYRDLRLFIQVPPANECGIGRAGDNAWVA